MIAAPFDSHGSPRSLAGARRCLRVAGCAIPVSWPWLVALGGILFVVAGGAEIARLNNPALQVGVDTARGQIVELIDSGSSQNFAQPALGIGGLWAVELYTDPYTRLEPADARVCQIDRLPGELPGLRLTWSDFEPAGGRDTRVEVTVQLEPRRPFSRWSIAVDTPAEIALIRFPRLLHLPPLAGESIALPYWAGLLSRAPRQALSLAMGGSRRQVDYPGQCSMQCLSFFAEGGPGLYVATDDAQGYRKAFAAFSEGGGQVNLELIHLPESAPGTPYRLPYSAIFGTYQGGWFDAASIYRTWATNRVWAKESRWKRRQVPAWIADTALWVWNRGASPQVLDPAIALRTELGLPVSVFWHWWHGCAYDTGFPEYLPPREGAAAFQAAVARAHAQQVHSLVYMNQRLWGMTTASWTNEHAAAYAVKDPYGRIAPEVYNVFTKLPCATMCLDTAFWRNKYAGLAAAARVGLGVDGIYMDQACSSGACYDPRHGHPLGGGTYWMRGFRQLQADLRARCAPHGGVTLAGEGCAENWLPYLDLFLALDLSRERFAAPDGWDSIPFFHAVYHDYAVFYGNYSSLTRPPYDGLWPAEFAPAQPLQLLDRKFSPQFCLEQARAFVWGQQPTLANFLPAHLSQRTEEIAFALRLAQLRQGALKYLRDGAMLPPPVVETPTAELPMSRLSIYAGQREPLKEFVKTVPLTLASAWRASDGGIGIAVVNISDQPLTPTLTLDATRCGLSPRGRLFLVGERTASPVGRLEGSRLVLKPTLPARDACVFEWRAR